MCLCTGFIKSLKICRETTKDMSHILNLQGERVCVPNKILKHEEQGLRDRKNLKELGKEGAVNLPCLVFMFSAFQARETL